MSMSFLKCRYCNKRINFQSEETLACRKCGQSYHRECLQMMELDEENKCTNVPRGNRKECGAVLTESLFPKKMSNLIDLTAPDSEDENFDDYEEEDETFDEYLLKL